MPPNSSKRRKPSLIARITHEREELRRAVDVMRDALRGLYRTQIPRMAAALAYRTIFGIVPTCVILLVVFGAIVSDAEIERGLSNILEYTKLNELVVDIDDDDLAPLSFTFDFGFNPVSTLDDAPQAAQSSGERLEAWVAELVTRIRSVPKKTIGFISALILVYAAIGMLVEVERAFNHVFRCVTGRSWWTRVTLYWTMLTLGMLLLAATFIVGNRFRAWVVDVDGDGALGWLRVNVLGFLATVAISGTLLTIAYMRIPNTRVHLRPALIGAVVAAILWEAGKWGFTHYIAFSTNYARLYGSLALIPIFLLWVYVTWLIVLFGLQVAYAMQIVGTNSHKSTRNEDTGPLIAEPGLILTVVQAIARDFDHGESVTTAHIAEVAEIPEPIAAIMVRTLLEAGYLHEVAGDHEEPVYALSRSPASIRCRDLIEHVMTVLPYDSDGPHHALREAERAALGDKTLDTITRSAEPTSQQ